jgi:hypothetical protein
MPSENVMRRMPPRERPRRGACWGSRWARVLAAACLAVVAVSLALPGPAAAYLCDDSRPAVVPPHPELISPSDYASPNDMECRVPEAAPSRRTKKRGSMSGLTVFVLAVAAALLIPIGARGIPASVDPYTDDLPFR